jgi:HPt (histidine-containing phosphotransfer) domain-containing protein
MIQLDGIKEVKSMQNNLTVQQIQQDIKVALELVMGDSSPEMLDEMSSIFLEDAIPLFEQMKMGLATSDFKAISVAAHTLKGSSATMGLEKFAGLCLALELGSKAQDTSQIGPFIAELEAEYTTIEEALRHFLL